MTLERVNESGQLPMGTIPSPMVEPPKRPEWGDFSCNVAMTLASSVRQPPLKVAGVLATSLREQFSELFERIDVAPPGFLNLTLHPLLDGSVTNYSGTWFCLWDESHRKRETHCSGICECESDRTVTCWTWTWSRIGPGDGLAPGGCGIHRFAGVLH